MDDEDEPDDDGTKSLDFEGGHGTFIAGIIAQLCPDADVHIGGVLSSFGDGDVAGVVAGLQAGLATADPPIDLVVMSLGAFLADDEPGLFGESVLQLLGDKVIGVAAAGNQATCRPFYPAALPRVIGVGAVTAAGRAWFSNFGGWVDVCAPGVDVVSTFLTFDEVADLFPDESAFTPRVYQGGRVGAGRASRHPRSPPCSRRRCPQPQRRRLRPDHRPRGLAPADDPRSPAHAGPRRGVQRMTAIAFPGHAGRWRPLVRWRSLRSHR